MTLKMVSKGAPGKPLAAHEIACQSVRPCSMARSMSSCGLSLESGGSFGHLPLPSAAVGSSGHELGMTASQTSTPSRWIQLKPRPQGLSASSCV